MNKPESERKYAIVIGSMKSGTTAIFSLLSQHPEICRSYPKEPAFFAKEDYREDNMEEYDKYWDCDNQNVRYFLEASTSYTKMPSFPNAAERIKASGIKAKFIYVMRHPLERINSQLNMSIAKNWTIFDKNNRVHQTLIDISRYYFQIKQYYKLFPKDDILLLRFEDFTSDPENIMDIICRFLDISPDFKFDFEKQEIHEGVMYSYTNNRILMYTKLTFRLIRRILYRFPLLIKFIKWLESLFDKIFGKKRVRLSLEDKERITSILKVDMKNLHDHFGFNTSKWKFIN